MGYLFILIAFALVAGAVVKMKPSKREQRLAAMRATARDQQISVRYSPIPYTAPMKEERFVCYAYGRQLGKKQQPFEYRRRISPMGVVEDWREAPPEPWVALAQSPEVIVIKGSERMVEVLWTEAPDQGLFEQIVELLSRYER